MQLSEYQARAAGTAVYPDEHPASGLAYTALGLAGEAGEVANQAKKVIRDDGGEITRERREKLASELGDTLWYLAMTAQEIGYGLEEIAKANLVKLGLRKSAGTVKGDGDER